MEIVAQILGIVALVIAVSSMVFKSKPVIMLCLTIYNVLTLVSYLLLGQYLGCILVGVATLRSFTYFIFALKNIKQNIFVYITFNVLAITFSILFWNAWFDVFMLINLIITTYTTWQSDVRIIKWGTLICTVFFVLYDIFAGAYVYIISELAFGVTAGYSLLFGHRNKNIDKIENKIEGELKEQETVNE